MHVPERLLVETIRLLDFIQGVLLEGRLHPMQDVEDMVLFRPPGSETRSKVKLAVSLRNERVEDVGEELDHRGPLGVVRGESEPELKYGVGVVTWTERVLSLAVKTLGR